jgi:TPR repeat protein
MKSTCLKLFLISAIFVCLHPNVSAQTETISPFFPKNTNNKLCESIENAQEDQQVRKFIDTILERIHLRNSITVIGCADIEGCQATIKQATPFILYNNEFLNGVKMLNFTETSLPRKQDDWEALCILAHELGHIYNFHFGRRSVGQTLIDLELEADEFAGVMMKSLGASLSEAQKVMYRDEVSETDSESHPSRQRRLEAIKKGWDKVGTPFPKSATEKEEVVVKEELLEANRKYNEQQETAALPVFLKFSESKHFTPSYQTDLGLIYFRGTPAKKADYKESVRWLKKAAEKNDDRAQLYLGLIYLKGLGVDINDSVSFQWFKKAALQGNTNAMLALFDMESDDKALQWLKKAADLGNTTAQARLGEVLYYGLNQAARDTVLATNYLLKSVDRNNALAYLVYGKVLLTSANEETKAKAVVDYLEPGAICLIQNRNLFITDDSLNRTDESDFMNALYFNSSLNDFFISVTDQMIDYYHGNDTMPINPEKSLEWMIEKAKSGDRETAFELGTLYERGDKTHFPIAKDLTQAIEMFELAEKYGHPKARAELKRLKGGNR